MERRRHRKQPLLTAGKEARGKSKTDHTGIFSQKQPDLNYIGLVVPVGRITTTQLFEVARIADEYGNGDIRLTQGQNLIITNVPDAKIGDLTAEPLLQELRYDPSEVMRGMVSCTGIDYCHFSLIETKERAMEAIRHLEAKLGEPYQAALRYTGRDVQMGVATMPLQISDSWARKLRLMGSLPMRWTYSSKEMPGQTQKSHRNYWRTSLATTCRKYLRDSSPTSHGDRVEVWKGGRSISPNLPVFPPLRRNP